MPEHLTPNEIGEFLALPSPRPDRPFSSAQTSAQRVTDQGKAWPVLVETELREGMVHLVVDGTRVIMAPSAWAILAAGATGHLPT